MYLLLYIGLSREASPPAWRPARRGPGLRGPRRSGHRRGQAGGREVPRGPVGGARHEAEGTLCAPEGAPRLGVEYRPSSGPLWRRSPRLEGAGTSERRRIHDRRRPATPCGATQGGWRYYRLCRTHRFHPYRVELGGNGKPRECARAESEGIAATVDYVMDARLIAS